MMVLTNGKTDVFQKPKGEDPEAVSESERGSFSCPKIELGSWELVAGWRGQSFRLVPSPSPEVTQASAPTGTWGRNARPVQVTIGRSETSPSCVTVKCIQPTGIIYTVTVSKVSVGFFLVVS